MSDFKEVMQKLSDAELINISINLRDEYQAKALLAADEELKSRNLSSQQIKSTVAESTLEKSDNQKLEIIENRVNELSDLVNPLTTKTTDKTIRIIAIGLTILILTNLFYNLSLSRLILLDYESWDISVLEYFLPKMFSIIGIYGFWQRKRFGFVFINITYTYFLVATFHSIVYEIHWMLTKPDFLGVQTFQERDLTIHSIQILLFSAIIYQLNKRSIASKFNVSRRTQFVVILGTAIPTLILWTILFL